MIYSLLILYVKYILDGLRNKYQNIEKKVQMNHLTSGHGNPASV